ARAQQELARQQAALAEALGQPAAQFTIEGQDLLQRNPTASAPPALAPPLLTAQRQAISAASFALRQSQLADRPRFALLGSGYGRGTSLLSGTRRLAVADGILPFSAGNWVLGAGVEFSFTRHWQAEKEQIALRASQQAEQARLNQIQDTLTLADRQARADLEAARQALRYAPIELAAAQAGEAQARARYTAGLSSIVDLANAEELLVKGQTDSLLSQIQIWRAQLKLNYAQGDLAPFLRQAAGN
ncbi:MAG: TolC family protein, partial [Terriglobales bacterium]